MNYKKIILIGMMGCGKTAISKELSKKLSIRLYECDKIFEEKNNITISDFFKKFNEESFRQKETELLKDILKNESYIISTGGGIVLSKENRDLIFNNKDIISIYLKTDIETIYSRIKDDVSRPLLQVNNPKEEIAKILNTREKYYKQATITIENSDTTIDETVNKIIEKI